MSKPKWSTPTLTPAASISPAEDREQWELEEKQRRQQAKREEEKRARRRQRFDERRAHRQRFINRFKNCQRAKREFIGFGDIVLACARAGHSTEAALYADLARSITEGDFIVMDDETARTKLEIGHLKGLKVLLLEPLAKALDDSAGGRVLVVDPRVRRDHIREEVEDLIAESGDRLTASPALVEYLRYCWLPREIARQWIADRDVEWPTRFNPTKIAAHAVGKRRPRDVTVFKELKGWVEREKAAGRNVGQEAACKWAKGNDGMPSATRTQIRNALIDYPTTCWASAGATEIVT